MSFFDELQKRVLDVEYNKSITENGAVGFKTTGTALLDMNFKISSYRNCSDTEIVEDFKKVFLEDKITALQFLFYIRDREEGLGERRTFRVILKALANAYPGYVIKVLPVIAEYGRWDDIFCLVDTKVKTETLELIKTQMVQDFNDMKENKPTTLLFKWLPSPKASNPEQRKLAVTIRQYLGINEKRYRVALSKMRKYLDVVEKKMCANEWDKISYEKVPSKANLIYRNAFLKHDKERREEYLENLSQGKTKINASKLFPYEIYRKSPVSVADTTLEELWKNLPDIKNDTNSVLVVADGSGSMNWTNLGDTQATALDVARSLAIYFAERAKGQFKDSYISFSSRPELVKLGGAEHLYEKKYIAERYNDCSNTDIEKTFDLILDTAVQAKMEQSEMPTTVLIISDMEFDTATTDRVDKTLFQTIEDKFKAKGYKLPRLVFWNVCGRTSTIPVITNDLGVALVSGFNTTIFDMVLNNKLDPLEILLDKLNTPRYLVIKELVK